MYQDRRNLYLNASAFFKAPPVFGTANSLPVLHSIGHLDVVATQ